jgi:Cu/Ag efflux protein CusF
MRLSTRLVILIAVVVALVFSSCYERKKQPGSDQRLYPVKGRVVAVMPQQNRITVAHEEIPAYMKAMTMRFTVKDANLLKAIQIGDTITATLIVSPTESWLQSITVLKQGKTFNNVL